MITALGVLLGIDMQAFSRPEGSEELPPGLRQQSTVSDPAEPTPPLPKRDLRQESVPEPNEETEESKAQKDAEQQKQLGSAAYRQRDFAGAEQAFSKAWEIFPKDITYLTNLSGT
jgi:stress-induced-phosphoprotein 1